MELELMRFDPRSSESRKVGHWSSSPTLSNGGGGGARGILLLLNETSLEDEEEEESMLTVVTKVERPYVMLRRGRRGNDAFEGFAIDLLKVREEWNLRG